jgi:nicotinamidase-related amidase
MAGKALIAYANDLDEGFHGSREAAIRQAMEGERPELVGPILPDEADSFIHKGQHSAFYGTPLAHLLKISGVDNIVLTGQVTEQCILYTALDAHVRGYRLTVPVDAVISRSAHLGAAALEMIAEHMSGELTCAQAISGTRS